MVVTSAEKHIVDHITQTYCMSSSAYRHVLNHQPYPPNRSCISKCFCQVQLASQPEKDDIFKAQHMTVSPVDFPSLTSGKASFQFDIEYIFVPLCCMIIFILLLKIFYFFLALALTVFAVNPKASLFSVFCSSQIFFIFLLLDLFPVKTILSLVFHARLSCMNNDFIVQKKLHGEVSGFSCTCFLAFDFQRCIHIEAPG